MLHEEEKQKTKRRREQQDKRPKETQWDEETEMGKLEEEGKRRKEVERRRDKGSPSRNSDVTPPPAAPDGDAEGKRSDANGMGLALPRQWPAVDAHYYRILRAQSASGECLA